MATVTLTIDGNSVVAEKGLTILELARRADIALPTLCYLKNTTSDHPCEICVVEITNYQELGLPATLETPGLFRACVTLVRDGMEIETASDKVVEHRQQRLALI